MIRKALAVLGVVLILGTIGSLSGPRWQPHQVERMVESERLDTTIGSDVATQAVGTYDVATEDVAIDLGPVQVEARLTYPVGVTHAGPGVVLVHGAGTGHARAFADQARELASAGIHVLVPAKRMDTYSVRHRDYEQMAAETLLALQVLREHPDVDARTVGIYGESEGAYIAAIAAAESPEVAFVVLVSAPVVPAREQFAFAADAYLRNTGAPEPLLRAIPRVAGARIPGGGFEYIDFDVRPFQQRLSTPVLMVYGTDDLAMPVVQGVTVMSEDLEIADNPALTVRYYEGANHGIRSNGQLVEGFTRDLSRWILGLPETAQAPPQVAGANPEQTYAAAPVARPAWYADGDWLIYSGMVAVLILLAAPAIWLADRLRRRDQASSSPTMPARLARLATATALGSLATVIVFVAYLAQVAYYALNYLRNDVVVVGGYLLMLATGVFVAGVLYHSVDRALRSRRSEQWRRSGYAIWWCLHVGSVGLLLIAAYWGVFPSFI